MKPAAMVSKAAMAIAAIGCLFEGLSGLPQRRRSVENRRPLSDANTGDFEFRIGLPAEIDQAELNCWNQSDPVSALHRELSTVRTPRN